MIDLIIARVLAKVVGFAQSFGLSGGVFQAPPAPPALPDPPKVPESPSFWMPNQASTFADSIDGLFNFLVWISVISTGGIVVAMIYFCVRYRARSRDANEKAASQNDHSTTLEITWSVIPLVIVIGRDGICASAPTAPITAGMPRL